MRYAFSGLGVTLETLTISIALTAGRGHASFLGTLIFNEL